MNWIRIDTGMLADPSIGEIAEALDARCSQVAGCVLGVLLQLPKHARDGDVSKIPNVTLESWADWGGARGAFAQAFRAHLCTPDGVVRSWDKYNGAAMRENEQARERMRKFREAKKHQREQVREQQPNGSPNVRVTFSERAPLRYDTRRDVTDLTATTTDCGPADAAPQEHALLALVPPPPKPRKAAKPTKPPKWPNWPKEARDAAYQHWLANFGTIDYARFISAAGPALGGGLPNYDRATVWNAWQQCVGIASIASSQSRFLRDPAKIGAHIAEACRILTTEPSVGEQARRLQLLLHGKEIA
jgi:hypothetical protein